jgi:hypothetical protein
VLVYDEVRDYLASNWTATPLLFDNETADSSGAFPTEAGGPFVRVEMIGDLYGAASIGAGSDDLNLYREQGQIYMTVIVPGGTGSRLARLHAKALIDLFRGRELASGRIRFRDGSLGLGQRSTLEGNWYELNASVDYLADS